MDPEMLTVDQDVAEFVRLMAQLHKHVEELREDEAALIRVLYGKTES